MKYSLDEIRHARVRIVHRTETAQHRHHRHPDNADARHRLLQREDALRHAEQRKRIADTPEAVQEHEPDQGGERAVPAAWHQPHVTDARVRNVVRNQADAHRQHGAQPEAPVKVARAGLHQPDDLEDD